MELGAGEIYFVKECDVLSKDETCYVKIGLVHENENEVRGSTHRALEHQTGNPRKLRVHHQLKTQLVSSVENKMHRFYAKNRVSGEWFNLTPELLESAIGKAKEFAVLAEKDFDFFNEALSLESVRSTEEVVASTETSNSLHQILLNSRFKLAECVELDRSYKNLLQQVSKDKGNIETYASTIVKKPRSKFDENALKEEHPEIWELFQVTKEKWSQRFSLMKSKDHVYDLNLSDPILSEFSEKFRAVLKNIETQKQPIDDLQELYFDLRILLSSYEWDEKVAESHLKILIADAKEIEGVCKWPRLFQKKVSFDKESFSEKHPDLFEKFSSMDDGSEVIVPKKFK
jgi:hypothetical protein